MLRSLAPRKSSPKGVHKSRPATSSQRPVTELRRAQRFSFHLLDHGEGHLGHISILWNLYRELVGKGADGEALATFMEALFYGTYEFMAVGRGGPPRPLGAKAVLRSLDTMTRCMVKNLKKPDAETSAKRCDAKKLEALDKALRAMRTGPAYKDELDITLDPTVCCGIKVKTAATSSISKEFKMLAKSVKNIARALRKVESVHLLHDGSVAKAAHYLSCAPNADGAKGVYQQIYDAYTETQVYAAKERDSAHNFFKALTRRIYKISTRLGVKCKELNIDCVKLPPNECSKMEVVKKRTGHRAKKALVITPPRAPVPSHWHASPPPQLPKLHRDGEAQLKQRHDEAVHAMHAQGLKYPPKKPPNLVLKEEHTSHTSHTHATSSDSPKNKSDSNAEPKVTPEAHSKAKPKADKTAPRAEKTAPKAASKAEPKVTPKPEPKAESKVTTKPEPNTESKVESKVAPKAKSKVTTRAELNVAPKIAKMTPNKMKDAPGHPESPRGSLPPVRGNKEKSKPVQPHSSDPNGKASVPKTTDGLSIKSILKHAPEIPHRPR